MKLAYVTTYDSSNIMHWSGTGYYIAKALKDQSISLEYISHLKEKYSLLFKAKKYLYNHLSHKHYLRDRQPLILKDYARQVSQRLSNSIDVVFSPGSIPIAYLECDQPVVFWTDATFAGMIDFYPGFSNLCKKSIKDGNAMEKSALERCKLAIYSSDWAAQTAITNYHINPSKIKVVSFGANIECNRTEDDIRNIFKSRPTKKCKLLFLGVNWVRKGGDVALKIAKELNKTGLNTELTIVGCEPILDGPLPDFVKPLGFISKSTKDGKEKFDKLLAETHFLVLPSRAECTAIVFGEVNSFGVPCLSTDVGGVPTIIRPDINGKLFSAQADIAEYCDYIHSLFTNYSKYENLVFSTFNEYQTRLNWHVAGQAVKKLLADIVR